MNGKKQAGERSDIAIIGMSCLFPGAPNLEAFWRNIVRKVDATSDPPPEAWDVDVFYDPESKANDRVYCKRGGFIAPIAYFDPLDHGVMPRAVEGGEPDQWLALRVAREAFADAGYAEEIPERRSTAVILGKGTYLNRGNLCVVQHGRMVDQTIEILKTLHPELAEKEIEEIRADLKRKMPPFNADTAPGLIPNIIAGRIANRLDLMGPNYTVDAACASSLIAVEHAIRGLRSREYDLALAGGVHVATPVPTLMLFCQLGALSRREEIRPFDALADGTVLGGGLGMVVLKRLEDAERDGNRIYATVKSVGVSSDGRGLGVMAPRPEGEELALRRAYEAAGVDPRSVGLIEAHGTGTPVGDATEVQALTSVFGKRNGLLPWCGLGSIKSMIGHAMPAAGIAGIIKTALSLYHRVLPPTLHVERPNPKLGLEASPFYLNTETRPWIHGDSKIPRRAGVNAFGFGGINAHALLEEAHAPSDGLMPWDSEVVILTGETRDEVLRRAREIEALTDTRGDLELRDLAASVNLPLREGDARLAIVASDLDDLREKLRVAASRLADPKVSRIRDARGIYYADEPLARDQKLAFLFPGEGSQYLDMLSDLCTHFPEVRRRFDFIDEVFRGHRRSYVPSDFIFPRPMFSPEEKRAAEERLWQMEGAFEAVLTADWALYELLRSLEVVPDAMLGHSTGEYAAMRAAGMMELETDADVARFARQLNDFYYRQGANGAVPPSALVALGADSASVAEAVRAIGGELFLAMDNCPHQTVVVGGKTETEALLSEAQRRGWIYERLSFDRPYHTSAFESYSEGLRDFLDEWIVRPPACALYSCASASRFPEEISACRELALKHWMSPVEFRKTIEKMHDEGVRIFVEVGPRGNLSAFVSDTLRGRPHLAVPVDSFSRPGITQLNHFVGLLAVHGVPMKLDALYRGRRVRRMAAGAEKTRRPMKVDVGWIPMGMSEEMAARLRAGQSAAVASSPVPVIAATAPPSNGTTGRPKRPEPTPVEASAESPDAVMTSYWKTMERFLSVQQEVMEGFLTGHAPATSPALPFEETIVTERPAVAETSTVAEVSEQAERAAPSSPPDGGLREMLLRIVSERTGYPVERIGLDLDLEADLGIDSIKRVEILGSLQQQTELVAGDDMESLAAQRTLGDVVRFLEARANGNAPGPARPTLAFLRVIEKWTPGEELVASAVLDLHQDLFLRDHALGRKVSTSDPELTGLAVVPLTMGMEMLAEAAVALAREPDRKVVGMRDVRAYRWMMLERGELSLKIVARRIEDGEGLVVQVKIFEGSASQGAAPLVEGKVVLAERYPEAPPAERLSLASERRSKWLPDRLYEEIMFHGPRFQGVRSMDRWGADGATATLSTLSADKLFASTESPALATDPVLLDQPGQVVGFWTAEHLERGYVVFPFQLDALDLYRAPGATPAELECRARIRLIGEEAVDSDLDVVARENRVESLVCRFSGWKDRRFDLPRAFLRFLHDPVEETLTEGILEERGGYRLRLQGFPAGFFTAHGAVWQKALAMLILGRSERRVWDALSLPPSDRVGWLFERLAAKDAARARLREKHGIELAPADVELQSETPGRFLARGPGGETLRVSTSRGGDDFVAVVGESELPALEAARRLSAPHPEPALGEIRK